MISGIIQKSTSVKNSLLSKLIKLKDADLKCEVHFRGKQYRNHLSTLLKRSKQSYFTNYFQTNINDLKKYLEMYQKVNISDNNFNFYTFCCY